MSALGVSKKTKKTKKIKKNNRKNQTVKKLIKQIKILKKPTGSVRFWIYKPKTKKIEPNRIQTGKKPSQTGKKRAKSV